MSTPSREINYKAKAKNIVEDALTLTILELDIMISKLNASKKTRQNEDDLSNIEFQTELYKKVLHWKEGSLISKGQGDEYNIKSVTLLDPRFGGKIEVSISQDALDQHNQYADKHPEIAREYAREKDPSPSRKGGGGADLLLGAIGAISFLTLLNPLVGAAALAFVLIVAATISVVDAINDSRAPKETAPLQISDNLKNKLKDSEGGPKVSPRESSQLDMNNRIAIANKQLSQAKTQPPQQVIAPKPRQTEQLQKSPNQNRTSVKREGTPILNQKKPTSAKYMTLSDNNENFPSNKAKPSSNTPNKNTRRNR